MELEQLSNVCWTMWTSTGGSKNDETDMKAKFKTLVQAAVDRAVVVSPKFSFATNTYTKTFTAIDTATQEISGANSDCREVLAILWGNTNKLLVEYDQWEHDFSFSGAAVGSADPVMGWYKKGIGAGGFPVIVIKGAVSSGDTMTVRYLRNDVTFNLWPDPWDHVIVFGVLALANPTFDWRFQNELIKMVRFYDTGRRGGEFMIPPTEIVRDNVRASDRNIG